MERKWGARGGRKKREKKTLTGSHKSTETELQCPLSLTRAHLWLGSLDLFTSTFSEDQSGLSDGLPRQEMTPLDLHYGRSYMKGQEGSPSGFDGDG